MTTLNEVVYSIAGAHGKTNDEVYIAELKFAIKFHAAKYIRDDYHRNGLSKQNILSFPVNLIKLDKSQTSVIDLDCDILRTENKIPRPIGTKNSSPFLFVGEIGFTKPFSYIESSILGYQLFNRFSINDILYTYENDYIWVYRNKHLKYLWIQSMFENPEEAIDLQLGELECYDDDMPFPVRSDILFFIIEGLIQGRLNVSTLHDDQEVKLERSK